MKIIKVTSCLPCPERHIIRTGINIGKSWCGLSQRILSDTLSRFPEWCALDDQPSNTAMQIDTKAPCSTCGDFTKSVLVQFCIKCGRPLSD